MQHLFFLSVFLVIAIASVIYLGSTESFVQCVLSHPCESPNSQGPTNQSQTIQTTNQTTNLQLKPAPQPTNCESCAPCLLPPNVFQSKAQTYAQHAQDLWLQENLFVNTIGTFIEAGALDGIFMSNTAYFEKYFRWQGFCFEGDATQVTKIAANRLCEVIPSAITSKDGEMTFTVSDVAGWSGFWDQFSGWKREALIKDGKYHNITVSTVRLDTIMQKYNYPLIDFFFLRR